MSSFMGSASQLSWQLSGLAGSMKQNTVSRLRLLHSSPATTAQDGPIAFFLGDLNRLRKKELKVCKMLMRQHHGNSEKVGDIMWDCVRLRELFLHLLEWRSQARLTTTISLPKNMHRRVCNARDRAAIKSWKVRMKWGNFIRWRSWYFRRKQKKRLSHWMGQVDARYRSVIQLCYFMIWRKSTWFFPIRANMGAKAKRLRTARGRGFMAVMFYNWWRLCTMRSGGLKKMIVRKPNLQFKNKIILLWSLVGEKRYREWAKRRTKHQVFGGWSRWTKEQKKIDSRIEQQEDQDDILLKDAAEAYVKGGCVDLMDPGISLDDSNISATTNTQHIEQVWKDMRRRGYKLEREAKARYHYEQKGRRTCKRALKAWKSVMPTTATATATATGSKTVGNGGGNSLGLFALNAMVSRGQKNKLLQQQKQQQQHFTVSHPSLVQVHALNEKNKELQVRLSDSKNMEAEMDQLKIQLNLQFAKLAQLQADREKLRQNLKQKEEETKKMNNELKIQNEKLGNMREVNFEQEKQQILITHLRHKIDTMKNELRHYRWNIPDPELQKGESMQHMEFLMSRWKHALRIRKSRADRYYEIISGKRVRFLAGLIVRGWKKMAKRQKKIAELEERKKIVILKKIWDFWLCSNEEDAGMYATQRRCAAVFNTYRLRKRLMRLWGKWQKMTVKGSRARKLANASKYRRWIKSPLLHWRGVCRLKRAIQVAGARSWVKRIKTALGYLQRGVSIKKKWEILERHRVDNSKKFRFDCWKRYVKIWRLEKIQMRCMTRDKHRVLDLALISWREAIMNARVASNGVGGLTLSMLPTSTFSASAVPGMKKMGNSSNSMVKSKGVAKENKASMGASNVSDNEVRVLLAWRMKCDKLEQQLKMAEARERLMKEENAHLKQQVEQSRKFAGDSNESSEWLKAEVDQLRLQLNQLNKTNEELSMQCSGFAEATVKYKENYLKSINEHKTVIQSSELQILQLTETLEAAFEKLQHQERTIEEQQRELITTHERVALLQTALDAFKSTFGPSIALALGD